MSADLVFPFIVLVLLGYAFAALANQVFGGRNYVYRAPRSEQSSIAQVRPKADSAQGGASSPVAKGPKLGQRSLSLRVPRAAVSESAAKGSVLPEECALRSQGVLRSEADLEQALVSDLSILRAFGYDLHLAEVRGKGTGRQFYCEEIKGFIDILCRDRVTGGYVVIELKKVRAGRDAFAQISAYMTWVEDHVARGMPVRGLVISAGSDAKFDACLRRAKDIQALHLNDVARALGCSVD